LVHQNGVGNGAVSIGHRPLFFFPSGHCDSGSVLKLLASAVIASFRSPPHDERRKSTVIACWGAGLAYIGGKNRRTIGKLSTRKACGAVSED